ncbi:uncharacterized protein LTR77_004966 [Saxophila tyrrhenica]|uniref:Uncharacterized protein n=1 Tax=Saxophila tyrrhenica TaxID=1690608 RepID=A0AAV9PAY4_9PEZI|nr:hypothetical protein LTR77_004966 [Saxophila tyrrhenica]
MGIPYSREINAAFEQVTPLVAAGFEVLETTKNIALALFFIQIFTAITLTFILLALIGLLYTLNPDLEHERKVFVTPTMKWMASWWLGKHGAPKSVAAGLVAVFALAGFGFLGWVYYKRQVEDATVENHVPAKGEEGPELKKGKDVENVKKGDTKQ